MMVSGMDVGTEHNRIPIKEQLVFQQRQKVRFSRERKLIGKHGEGNIFLAFDGLLCDEVRNIFKLA